MKAVRHFILTLVFGQVPKTPKSQTIEYHSHAIFVNINGDFAGIVEVQNV